ncbi:hypothetical protein JK202_12320 [Gluconobacter sp. Dm-62]|uniref:hypothetical protein n=1 Tax=Gluconobacter sp. Dm-62 TaxID=2799804 RepID=UPI001B8CAD12|nr:hypothetical protein [Gluconobacter sp. Dm-62]MBS1103788.1 hypothetical protein [Gluconobacter sp. Dm-62]
MSIIDDTPFEGEDRKYRVATEQAEAALRARQIGDDALAERLLNEAERTDPEALANVLQRDSPASRSPNHTTPPPASDEEVAAITRTVQPGADAPSRAGILDGNGDADGSGADSQKR